MRKSLFVPLAAAIVLSGCGSSGDDAEGGKTPTAEEVAAEAAKLEIRPGLYTITTSVLEMNMDGVPPELAKGIAGGIKGTEVRHCLTEADAQKAMQQMNEGQGQAGGDCTYKTFEVNGSNFKSEMTCNTGQGSGTIKGEGTIAGEKWDYVAETEFPGMKMKAHVTAARAGECTG